MENRKRVGVFVYGDIGRSPRMQNHAEQLSKKYQVYFMGYIDTSPRQAILQNQFIHLVDLEINGLGSIRSISFYVYALVRIVLQLLQIVYLLGIRYRGLQFVLIQNPPSIPNLFGIWLTSFISRFKIYIDFHNYGYTILNLKVKNKLINLFAKKYQHFFGRKCQKAFCVSDAMKQDLKNHWNIDATTLYDRPRDNFVKEKTNKKEFFMKYGLPVPEDELLIVSSTSWTKDEDFSILLNAIDKYEKSSSERKIRAYITGKGPQKQFYLQKIAKMRQSWNKVSIDTVWLDADDYPTLLSMCDLGISLHYSSSGVDLPMKVVDMFGAGIPVLAINYRALNQLVKNGKNGYVFADSQQLLEKLTDLAQNEEKLKLLKKQAKQEQQNTWEKEWKKKFN